MNLKICYFGAYSKTYSRNAINIYGLNECGAKIVFCHVGKPKFKSESRFSFILCAALYPITLPARSAYSFFKGLFLYFYHSYDIILVGYQGHFDVPAAFLLSRIIRKPLVFDALESLYDVFANDKKLIRKGSLLAKIIFVLEKFIYILCDIILIDTESNKRFFTQLFRIQQDKVFATQLGADDRIYNNNSGVYRAKQPGIFNVVFYGQQAPLHGLKYAIQAADICKRDPSIQFFLVGGGQSYNENVALVKELGLANVTFSTLTEATGALDIVRAADIMLGVFANNDTGLRSIPNKVIQGMAMKIPVLTGQGVGVSEKFKHKKDIYLCSTENPHSIADAIFELKSDVTLRETIAKNGYALYQEQFSPKAIASKLIEIFNDAIHKKYE